MNLSTPMVNNYTLNTKVVKDKISGNAEVRPEAEAGRERYRKVSFPFCAYNSVIITPLSPLGDNHTALPYKAPCRVLAHRIVILMRVATPSLPMRKNFRVNCAVFWRKRDSVLPYLDTLAKDVTILYLVWWFYDH